MFLPLQGASAIHREGLPFDAPNAREAVLDASRKRYGDVEFVELPRHIHVPAFSETAAQRLLPLMRQKGEANLFSLRLRDFRWLPCLANYA